MKKVTVTSRTCGPLLNLMESIPSDWSVAEYIIEKDRLLSEFNGTYLEYDGITPNAMEFETDADYTAFLLRWS